MRRYQPFNATKARYSVIVLKVPLNRTQPVDQSVCGDVSAGLPVRSRVSAGRVPCSAWSAAQRRESHPGSYTAAESVSKTAERLPSVRSDCEFLVLVSTRVV